MRKFYIGRKTIDKQKTYKKWLTQEKTSLKHNHNILNRLGNKQYQKMPMIPPITIGDIEGFSIVIRRVTNQRSICSKS